MATITICPVTEASKDPLFRATAGRHESIGPSPGAALDALAADLADAAPARWVVVIEPAADDGLTKEQRRRLDELKGLYRLASAGLGTMSNADRDEMEWLSDALFAASERRAVALGPAE